VAQEQERDPQPATGEAKRAHRRPCSISATMQSQRWSGVVAAALVLGTAAPATAGEPVALAYEAPPGCPAAAALRDGVVQRLGAAAIADRAPVTIAVAISSRGAVWQVDLAVRGAESPGDPPARAATCAAAMELAIARAVEIIAARAAILQAAAEAREFVPRGRIALGAGAASELFDGFGDLVLDAEVGTAGAKSAAVFVRIVEGSEPQDGVVIKRNDVTLGVQGCASWRWFEGCVRLGGDRWSQARHTATYIAFRESNWGLAVGARVSAVVPFGEHLGIRVGVSGTQRSGYETGSRDFAPWQRGYAFDAAGLLWF